MIKSAAASHVPDDASAEITFRELGGRGEAINSPLREVIWCIWVCAVGQ